MSSRLVSTALPMRTSTRTGGIASVRWPQNLKPKSKPVDRKTTRFATLDDSTMESTVKVQSSPTESLAKSLSHQITSSTPPASSLSWPVDAFAKAFEKDGKLDELCTMCIFDVQQDQTARAGKPVEKESWLERFGGPGKMLDNGVGRETGVMREVGMDRKGYLRVLI